MSSFSQPIPIFIGSDPRERAGTSKVMASLVDRPDRARAWGSAGQRRARARFTVGHHMNQISAMLHALMDRS